MRGATEAFDAEAYRAGQQTPVFFGSAINNFGVEELLAAFSTHAPGPLPRVARERLVEPPGSRLWPASCSRSRPTWTRRTATASPSCACAPASTAAACVCSTCASTRRCAWPMHSPSWPPIARQAEEAFAGDIIGLHNHGTINIGDTFTQGERLAFTGVPNFAPEIFRRAVLKDPLKMKALQKGLSQLCEEGATQLFKPLRNNDLILGAVGQLQFEVVAFRLADEYGVQCVFDPVTVYTARWIDGGGPAQARGVPRPRLRASGGRSQRRAGLPRALARQPAARRSSAGRTSRFHQTREYAARLTGGVPSKRVERGGGVRGSRIREVP